MSEMYNDKQVVGVRVISGETGAGVAETVTLLSDPAGLGYWQVPLAGFAASKYLGPLGVDDTTGFDITDCEALVVSYDNGATATVNIEQTNDPTGAFGWYAVAARQASSTTSVLSTSSASSGSAYIVPVVGLRARLRVSALTVADVRARVSKAYNIFDNSPGQVSIISAVNEDSAATSSNALGVALEARNTQKTNMSATGDVVRAQGTMDGKQVMVPHAVPELTWAFAAAASGIVSSTADVVLKTAGAAGIRNFLDSLSISHDVLSAVTEYVIKDGAAIIYRGKLQTAAMEGFTSLKFDPPLRGTAATALNFALLTSVTGGVYVNAQGHTGN